MDNYRAIIAYFMVALVSASPAYGMKYLPRMTPFLRGYSTHPTNYLHSMRQLRMDRLDAVQRLRMQRKASNKLTYLVNGKISYHGTDLALTADKAFPNKEEIEHYQGQLDNEPIYVSATTNEEFCVRNELSEDELKKQLDTLQKRMRGPRLGWHNMLQVSRGLSVPAVTAYLSDLYEIGINHPLVFLGTAATAGIYGLCNAGFGIKHCISRWLFLRSKAGQDLVQQLENKKKHYQENQQQPIKTDS